MRKWDGGLDGEADGPADEAPRTADPADAAEIEALLRALSELRLSVSADLSAVAGALDAERPDIAAEVVTGARRDVAHLSSAVKRHELPLPIPALVSAGGGSGRASDDADQSPDSGVEPGQTRRRSWRGHHAGRILVGAMALALAVVVGPQLGGSSGSKPKPAAAPTVAPSVDFHLVSAEFQQLRSALAAPKPTPTAMLVAGRRWQATVARSLPVAATNVSEAKQVVSLLRQERTLLVAAPTRRTPALRAASTTLISSADTLLATLRSLANAAVLAVLPHEITTLPTTRPHRPVPTAHPTAPKKRTTHQPPAGTTTTPVTPPTRSTGPVAPLPLPVPKLPSLPIPVPAGSGPSTPLQLPGAGTGSGTQLPLPLPSVLNQTANGLTSGLTNGLSGH